MVYSINVKADKQNEFLKAIRSLMENGLIESFSNNTNPALDGPPLTSSELLEMLDESEKEQGISHEDAKKLIDSWTK